MALLVHLNRNLALVARLKWSCLMWAVGRLCLDGTCFVDGGLSVLVDTHKTLLLAGLTHLKVHCARIKLLIFALCTCPSLQVR